MARLSSITDILNTYRATRTDESGFDDINRMLHVEATPQIRRQPSDRTRSAAQRQRDAERFQARRSKPFYGGYDA